MSTSLSPTSRGAVRTDPSVLPVVGPPGNAGSDSEETGYTQHCQLTQGPIPKCPTNPMVQNQFPKDWSRYESGLWDSLHIDLTHDSCFLGFSFPSFHQISSSSFSTILCACLAVRRQGQMQAEQMKRQRQERSSNTPSLLLAETGVSARTSSNKQEGSGCHSSQDRAPQECVGKHIFHTIPVLRKHPMQIAMITKFIINWVFHDVSDNMLMWFFTSSCSEQMAPFTLLSTSSVIISWCQKPPAAPWSPV